MVLHNKKITMYLLRLDDKTKSLNTILHEVIGLAQRCFQNTFNSSKNMETLLSRN